MFQPKCTPGKPLPVAFSRSLMKASRKMPHPLRKQVDVFSSSGPHLCMLWASLLQKMQNVWTILWLCQVDLSLAPAAHSFCNKVLWSHRRSMNCRYQKRTAGVVCESSLETTFFSPVHYFLEREFLSVKMHCLYFPPSCLCRCRYFLSPLVLLVLRKTTWSLKIPRVCCCYSVVFCRLVIKVKTTNISDIWQNKINEQLFI